MPSAMFLQMGIDSPREHICVRWLELREQRWGCGQFVQIAGYWTALIALDGVSRRKLTLQSLSDKNLNPEQHWYSGGNRASLMFGEGPTQLAIFSSDRCRLHPVLATRLCSKLCFLVGWPWLLQNPAVSRKWTRWPIFSEWFWMEWKCGITEGPRFGFHNSYQVFRARWSGSDQESSLVLISCSSRACAISLFLPPKRWTCSVSVCVGRRIKNSHQVVRSHASLQFMRKSTHILLAQLFAPMFVVSSKRYNEVKRKVVWLSAAELSLETDLHLCRVRAKFSTPVTNLEAGCSRFGSWDFFLGAWSSWHVWERRGRINEKHLEAPAHSVTCWSKKALVLQELRPCPGQEKNLLLSCRLRVY